MFRFVALEFSSLYSQLNDLANYAVTSAVVSSMPVFIQPADCFFNEYFNF